MKIHELMNAWEEGVERALGSTARPDELGETKLNSVAGMALHSGLRGGNDQVWGLSEHEGCTERCSMRWC